MGTGLIAPLDGTQLLDARDVGGKAARLNELARAGYRVPLGFCLTTAAYSSHIAEHRLESQLRVELGRKPAATMRWEELWDSALRLRALFLARPLTTPVIAALDAGLSRLGHDTPLAVRSSAPREDTAQASFAGLHESVVGVRGAAALYDAVRVVWASLWSDAALLYMSELGMDPAESRMAVVLQRQVATVPSGVAFGIDPRQPSAATQIVEAVPGPCGDLVDGAVDPDRWVLDRASGAVKSWRAGARDGAPAAAPLLGTSELDHLHATLRSVEDRFRWPPDIEWTGRGVDFHVLQARPASSAKTDDPRRWYLGLRPGLRRLRELRGRVSQELIPALIGEGEALAAEELDDLDDLALAAAIEGRAQALQRWRAIYRDDFIPLAHGLRALGIYYNDLVRPADPFEFVGLVRGEELRALARNRALLDLAAQVRADQVLAGAIERTLRDGFAGPALSGLPRDFLDAFAELRSQHFDLEFAGERLCERPDALLGHLLQLARQPGGKAPTESSRAALEQRLRAAAGTAREREVDEMLATGRLSWRLRDDDNLLLGRVESQLLRAIDQGCQRLIAANRAVGEPHPQESSATAIVAALRDPTQPLEIAPREELAARLPDQGRPRQLVGQPASPGLATGPARHVRRADDIGQFRAGDVLVCDAIQPTMTHLVPLACGIVERRGGMLIHGAIIARELGIPCVNGVSRSLDDIPDGEVITVDGELGIVTVGAPELGPRPDAALRS